MNPYPREEPLSTSALKSFTRTHRHTIGVDKQSNCHERRAPAIDLVDIFTSRDKMPDPSLDEKINITCGASAGVNYILLQGLQGTPGICLVDRVKTAQSGVVDTARCMQIYFG